MNSQQKSEMHSYLPPASWLIGSKARATVKTSALGKRHVPGLTLREAESLLGSPVQTQELRELPTRFNAVRCWTAASVKKKKTEIRPAAAKQGLQGRRSYLPKRMA